MSFFEIDPVEVENFGGRWRGGPPECWRGRACWGLILPPLSRRCSGCRDHVSRRATVYALSEGQG